MIDRTPRSNPPRSPARLGHRGVRRSFSGPALAVVAAAVLVAVLAAPFAPGAGRAAGGPASPPVTIRGASFFGPYSNGAVTLTFPGPDPSVAVSSIQDPRVSTTLNLSGLAEIAPGPQPNFTAFASFAPPSAHWTLLTRVLPGGIFEMMFSGTTAVFPSQGAWESADDAGEDTGAIGNASVAVNIYLNESGAGSPNATRVSVNATTWPWQNTSDSLGLSMRLVAANLTRIAPPLTPTLNLVREVTNDTGASVASLSWASQAAIQYRNGSAQASNVSSYAATSPSGANSTVRVLFGSVPGGYASLSYDPIVALDLAAFPTATLPAWMLDAIGYGILAGGLTSTALLAVAVLRRRRAPSDDDL